MREDLLIMHDIWTYLLIEQARSDANGRHASSSTMVGHTFDSGPKHTPTEVLPGPQPVVLINFPQSLIIKYEKQ